MTDFTNADEGKYIKILKCSRTCGACRIGGDIKQIKNISNIGDESQTYGVNLEKDASTHSTHCSTCGSLKFIFV